MTTRDQRLREHYQKLLDPKFNASEAEKTIARERLAQMKATPPGGPSGPPPGHGPRPGFRPGFKRWWEGVDGGPTVSVNPEGDFRSFEEFFRHVYGAGGAKDPFRTEADKMHARIQVEAQRTTVEQIPFWREDPGLVGLHAADYAWSGEEKAIFARVAGRPQNFPSWEERSKLILLVGAATKAGLTREEQDWVHGLLRGIIFGGSANMLALKWLDRRGG